jgi:xanthine dehydrogenase accessory factor
MAITALPTQGRHPFKYMLRGPEPRPVAIVLGCDEIGSAVAHRLHGDGFAVVLIDAVDPPWPRRGMAFTDAWYAGAAELAGVSAVFCASVRSIPAVLDRTVAVAATTWSWAGVASALSAVSVIETRPPSARRASLARSTAPPLLTLEVVPGAIAGPEFDLAIRLPAPHPIRERVLYAPCDGRFGTLRSIGELVAAGETVGSVGNVPIVAPIGGCLRGISARGARLRVGGEVVEIDPRADPARCFGLDERSSAIADAVSEALQAEPSWRGAAARKRGVTAAP